MSMHNCICWYASVYCDSPDVRLSAISNGLANWAQPRVLVAVCSCTYIHVRGYSVMFWCLIYIGSVTGQPRAISHSLAGSVQLSMVLYVW